MVPFSHLNIIRRYETPKSQIKHVNLLLKFTGKMVIR
uniref:Uncharacterized protein n=1 Tax=Arundo donax TaxID=35708 RepID=A0A0A8Z2C4_ARUDO